MLPRPCSCLLGGSPERPSHRGRRAGLPLSKVSVSWSGALSAEVPDGRAPALTLEAGASACSPRQACSAAVSPWTAPRPARPHARCPAWRGRGGRVLSVQLPLCRPRNWSCSHLLLLKHIHPYPQRLRTSAKSLFGVWGKDVLCGQD